MIKHKPATAVRAAGTPLRRFQQTAARAAVRIETKKRLPRTQDGMQPQQTKK